MAFPIHFPALHRSSVALVCAGGLVLASCEPAGRVDLRPELEQAKAEIAKLQRSLNAAEHQLALKSDELAQANIGFQGAEKRLREIEDRTARQDAQLQGAQAELATLKKNDALAFAEILALPASQPTVAAGRYQKFIETFPKSPLLPQARTALAQLTVPTTLETRKPVEAPDPKKREREFQKTFSEGYMTLAELAPVLKRKSTAQVLALLGRPNQTFNEGTEIGYEDRAINPATGTRGMFIVTFESGTVAALRVEYGGRKVVP